MALSEYEAMERDELEDKLAESRKELFNLRFQKATGQLDNTARLGHVKKEVARILTVLRQQDLGIGEPVIIDAPAVADEPASPARVPRRRARRSAAAEKATETGDAGADEDEEEA
jgi:large subunit ribosomal protein L29